MSSSVLVYKMGDKLMENIEKVYCDNCGFELHEDELEIGLCDLCYDDFKKEEQMERRHPDE